jgi:hypothetical protein
MSLIEINQITKSELKTLSKVDYNKEIIYETFSASILIIVIMRLYV